MLFVTAQFAHQHCGENNWQSDQSNHEEKSDARNSKSKAELWRLWSDFQTFFHEKEKIVPGVKEHVTGQSAQIVEERFSCP